MACKEGAAKRGALFLNTVAGTTESFVFLILSDQPSCLRNVISPV